MSQSLSKIAVWICLSILPVVGAHANDRSPYPMPRTEVVPIQQNGTDRQYELYIKLPDDYEESSETSYPVIYTTDAAVHMDMLSGTTEFLMPDVILVGISYQQNLSDERPDASRFRDYSVEPFSNPELQARFQAGQAANHLAFIRDEIIPYVEENYRTDPTERTYFGYSLGGAFGGYILLSEPATFKNYVLGSPSFARDDTRAEYFRSLEARTARVQKHAETNVFVSVGGLEKAKMEATENFVSVLRRRHSDGLSISALEIISDADHAGAFPETAIRGVKWLARLGTVTGPYLGQKPPGLIPEVFAPGIVSTEDRDFSGFFSPDMQEFYFTRLDLDSDEWSLIAFRMENNQWRQSLSVPRVGRPIISPDGNIMHLGKDYMKRTDDGWSEVKSLGPMFDREGWYIGRLASSADGTYVFDDYRSGNAIRISTIKDGERQESRLLGKEINTGKFNAHPFIAPDGSYLIWDGEREGDYGGIDLWISFRQRDGSWGEAINMGPTVNTSGREAGGYVSPDGKYFFFNSNRSDGQGDGDIYWMDAQIIENLRSQNENGAKAASPYLGQKPPGSTPERFAPGLISTEHWEYGGVFSPDMKEFYYLKNGGTEQTSFVVVKYKDDQWQEVVISPRVGQPFISPDGKTMHLGKRYMDRIEGGWSERKNLGGAFESTPIMRLTASSRGTYVFDEFTRDGNGLIRYSRLEDGKRQAPQPFGGQINSGEFDAHPFIAPDESYIIWDSKRGGGFGDSDIYVSFRQPDGAWGEAVNLGDKVNTDAWEASASVTPDGKYLLFSRNMGSDAYEDVDIFWVDAQLIEDLRHKTQSE